MLGVTILGEKRVQPGLRKRSHEGKTSKTNSQRKLVVSIWAILPFAKRPEAGMHSGWGKGLQSGIKSSQQEGLAPATNPGLKKPVEPHPVPSLSG